MLKKIFYSFCALIFSISIISFFLINDGTKFGYLKSKISVENKKIIKKYFFPYNYAQDLENYIDLLQGQIDRNSKEKKKLFDRITKKDEILSELSEKLGYAKFYHVNTQNFKIKNKNYKFKEFKDDFLEIKKHGDARSGSIYVDKIDDKIIILAANGNLQFFNINDLNKNEFVTKTIKTNIRDLIKYKSFYTNSNYGIKDLLIFKNYMYFSFNREVKKDCYNTSILRAKLNYENLIFEEFFYPDECVDSNKENGFTPHSAGGRLVGYNDKIIFSNGEYLERLAAQDLNSILGKILLLDPLKPNTYDIISAGHRNVQGLYFDEAYNALVSTEHGPMGGDEVNANIDLNKKIINFGWPISSYGEHYNLDPVINAYHPLYILAPLHKSHKKYGFQEPIQYFVPSIAISQIVKLKDKMIVDNRYHNFIFGALGSDPKEGDMSLHYIEISENYKNLISHEVLNINSRVRDIIILDSKSILVMMETNATIGILSSDN